MNLFLLFAGGSGLTETHGSHLQISPASSLFGAGRDLSQDVIFARHHIWQDTNIYKTADFKRLQILQDTGLQVRGCDLVEDQCWGRLIDVASRRRTLSVIQPSTEPSLLAHIESRTWELSFPCRPQHCRPPWSPPPTINQQPHQQHINTTIINPPFSPCRPHCPTQTAPSPPTTQSQPTTPSTSQVTETQADRAAGKKRSFVRGQLVLVTSHQYSSSSIFHMLIYIKGKLAKPLS